MSGPEIRLEVEPRVSAPKRALKAVHDFFIPWVRENEPVEKILRELLKPPKYGIDVSPEIEETMRDRRY